MKKSVKTIGMIILFIIICAISLFSDAAIGEYKVQLQSDKNKYQPGETVKIVVSVEDIKLDEGIAAISAILNYDETIFEEVTAEEIDEWDTPMLIDDMMQVTRKDMLNSKDNQNVASISLKIRQDVEVEKTIVSLSKFDVTDGNQTIGNDGVSMDIEIEAKQAEKIENEKSSNIAYIILGIVIITIVVVLVVVINKRKSKK